MRLSATVRGKTFVFRDVREVMAKANEEKSGDGLAGVAAATALERVAAKLVLSELTLADLHENPCIPYAEDEVTRLIWDELSRPIFDEVRAWTVGRLREHVLDVATTGRDLLRLGRGLTSEMIAACAKLMSNLDLIVAAQKIRVVVHANNTVGLPGRLAIRLQPNHPSDDVDGILASMKEGLSFGAGDAVVGINPVTDNPEQTR